MIQQFDPNFKNLEEIKVERPDKEEIINALDALDERLLSAKDGKEAVSIVKEYFTLSDNIRTIFSLIYIHYTINTQDSYYKELSELIDNISPEISEHSNKFDKDFFDSPFRKELVEAFGQLYFDEVELSNKTFSKEIVPDLVEENRLTRDYINLVSSALIEFRGEKYSLSQMGKFTTSLDRETRKEASQAVWGFYSENDDKIGDIYDKMVKVRTKIAHKLGYKNFLYLGYDRMGRLDWTPEDAAIYRKKILENIVPLSEEIFRKQKERIGYEDIHFYDYSIFYKTFNFYFHC